MKLRVKPLLLGVAIPLLALALLQALPAMQATTKSPVPNPADQDKAFKLVLDIFADDLKNASDSDAKAKLAAFLLQQGKEVKDDPAIRYVCFREARDLAARAGDASLALSVIDETSRFFEVDAMQLKAESLAAVVAAVTDKEAAAPLVDLIRPLLSEALDLDNYKAARLLGEAAVNAAKKARSPSLVLELQKRNADVAATEKNFVKQYGYLEILGKNPNDGVANLELGKYFGFRKKRWEKALPYFAAGNDKTLQELARRDLGQPADAKAQLALADNWWQLASTEKDSARIAIQLRASYWYEKALPGLAGLNRTKASKRIELVQEQASAAATSLPIVGPVGEVKKFEGHSDEIKGVALSADGKHAASGGRDQTVRIWDLATGKEAYILRGHTKEVWAVAFHPNNRNVFSVSWDATVRLWDFKTGNELKRYTHGKDVNGIALSRDASTMLVGCDDEKVYYWNVGTGEEIRKFSGHTNYVYAVAFAPDGRHIASGGVDKTVRVFDLNTGQPIKTFEGQNESVTNVAFTADSRQILSSGDTSIHVWNMATGGKAARRFEGHTGRIPAMAISPDGRRLLTGGDDRTIKLWEVATGKLLHSFTGHTDTVTCVAFSSDGRRAVSGSFDRTVRLWNLPAR